jgi:DnaJ homolog subfamily C member 19
MIALLLGCASLLVLMAALGMFSRAQVASIKQMGIWVAAIGGLLLAVLLFLTGRGGVALAALVMLGPLVWSWVIQARPKSSAKPAGGRPRQGAMTRAEALEVLGLAPGATREEIQAAYVRLMRAAHPDKGGSDWLAARINQARDVLMP